MKPLVLDTNVLIRFLERGGDYAETFSRFDRLLIPIKASPHIVCANALTTDWGELLKDSDQHLQPDSDQHLQGRKCWSESRFDYIMGNPPFSGRSKKSDEQQHEVSMFFDYKDADYVAAEEVRERRRSRRPPF